MKNLIILLTAIFIMGMLSGCKSNKVSRTFDSDIDATREAVVAVAGRISSQEPKVDESGKKITTGWVSGDVVTEMDDNLVSKESVGIWRGIITLQSKGAKTEVTVKLQKGDVSSKTVSGIESRSSSDLSYTIWTSEVESQNKFLDDIALELKNQKK